MSRLILLNGPSSAGKSTLARAIQDAMDEPFLRFSLDLFLFGGNVLPARRDPNGAFSRTVIRPRLFAGFYGCIGALLAAGNDLIVDHIIETEDDLAALRRALAPHESFFVGVHCPIDVLEAREQARGDRRVGDARRDLTFVHTVTPYDAEVDTRGDPADAARAVVAAWRAHTGSGALTRP